MDSVRWWRTPPRTTGVTTWAATGVTRKLRRGTSLLERTSLADDSRVSFSASCRPTSRQRALAASPRREPGVDAVYCPCTKLEHWCSHGRVALRAGRVPITSRQHGGRRPAAGVGIQRPLSPPPPPTTASPDRRRSPPATAPAVWATRPSTPRARDRGAGRACRGCARAVGSPFAAAHTLPAPSGWDRAARRLAWTFPSQHRDREGRGGAIEGLSGATVNSSGRSVWGRARKARRPTTRNRERPTQKERGGQRKDTATPPRP